MDALKEVKEWLLFKFQPGPTKHHLEASTTKTCSALTPQTIPEFVIPGSGNSSRRTSSEICGDLDLDFEKKRNSYGGRSCHESPPGTPVRMATSGSVPCMQIVAGSKSRSAPVTPKRELLRTQSQREAQSDLTLTFSSEGTNDDPHSMAAMSLPHFRANTSFGFSTLSENPHTRRKESLFHLGNESLLPRRNRSKFARNSKLGSRRDGSTPDICLLSTPAMTSLNAPSTSMPSVIVTAAQKNSSSRSPSPDLYSFADQCHRRLSPTYRVHSTDGLQYIPSPSNYNRFYNRRRSSLQIAIQPSNNNADSSSGSGMSTPSSLGSMEQVNGNTRTSHGHLPCQPLGSPTGKRHSAPNIPSDENMNNLPKPRSSSCQFISKEGVKRSQSHLFAPFGELKFSFQYLPASTQLKVTIIKAENLGGHQKQDRQLNTFARVYLMPGKLQKQNGPVIKKTRNPLYNQDFYFHNIDIDELRHMTLLVKIFSKSLNSLKPNEFIGKATILLDNYDVTMENRIWKDLELSREKEEFGFLHFGLKYSRTDGILTIRVEEAKALPLHPITGPPNPYVCIEVAQPGRHVTKQQTNTIKGCANPRFMQTFNFDVAPDFEAMQNTSVILAVFDHDRIRSDVLIGQVVLGCLATEVSQYGHWQEMLENAGFMTTKWHYLVDRDD